MNYHCFEYINDFLFSFMGFVNAKFEFILILIWNWKTFRNNKKKLMFNVGKMNANKYEEGICYKFYHEYYFYYCFIKYTLPKDMLFIFSLGSFFSL